MPCYVTGHEVTAWWERREGAQAYRIVRGGMPDETTDKTYIRYTAEEKHTLTVLAGDGVCLEETVAPEAPVRQLDIRDFGAVGDGKTLNTRAIQAAIDACGNAEVVIPEGVFLTGALRLHSHMRLLVEKGGVLQGTADPADYLPRIPSRFEGIEGECYQSLLNLGDMDHAHGPNAGDVVIHGEGTIAGGGQPLALAIIAAEKERLREVIARMGEGIRDYENENTLPGRARGRLINLSNCEHVRITGLTLCNGASWNVHMLYCRDIVTDHCVFRSEEVWNGDGWDPDSSEGCVLFASTFYTGDDSVAIKSGKNPEGNRIARPARHIRIFGCRSEYGLGVAIGSEMSGGVEDVRIWDCDLEHSLYGIQIKGTRKRGGYVRDIRVTGCVLPRLVVCAPTYNDDGEGAAEPPRFSDIALEHSRLTGWCRNYWEKEDHTMPCVDISGFDVPGFEASGIRVRDCVLPEGAVLSLTHCSGLDMTGIRTLGSCGG